MTDAQEEAVVNEQRDVDDPGLHRDRVMDVDCPVSPRTSTPKPEEQLNITWASSSGSSVISPALPGNSKDASKCSNGSESGASPMSQSTEPILSRLSAPRWRRRLEFDDFCVSMQSLPSGDAEDSVSAMEYS
ncbi:hypothetical protein V5799_022612 [Amblyomma americanum]|uniref:Uncharacterized protein n=1 Tax=Amblyomma americanum TaxID=6943 RepID=A0AAQ4FLE8_AMBAM